MEAYWKAGKNQLENLPLASTIPKEDSYGELYGSKLIGVIGNEPKVVGQGALAVKNAETATINSTVNNFNKSDAEKGLKLVYEQYGPDMAKIVEKMY